MHALFDYTTGGRPNTRAYPLALCTPPKQSSDDRPPCLENPRPEGADSTLTENAASPFHAEPKQNPKIEDEPKFIKRALQYNKEQTTV